MADLGFHKIHFPNAALILLECSYFSGVRRPQQNGAVAVDPPGVVGGVSEVLDAVRCELRLFSARYIAHPQIVITQERRALAIRRILSFGPFGCTLGGLWFGRAFAGFEIASPLLRFCMEGDGFAVSRKLKRRERQVRRVVSRSGGRRKSSSHFRMVKCRVPR